MWVPFKDILTTIETAILHQKGEVYAELDEVLTRHKNVFVSLLKNPVSIFVLIILMFIAYKIRKFGIHFAFIFVSFLL